jgi:hypothetical protein
MVEEKLFGVEESPEEILEVLPPGLRLGERLTVGPGSRLGDHHAGLHRFLVGGRAGEGGEKHFADLLDIGSRVVCEAVGTPAVA